MVQKIKRIFLVAWNKQRFLDKHEVPLGVVGMPDNSSDFASIWKDAKFGDFDSFEEAKAKISPFAGGIMQNQAPFQQAIQREMVGFVQEEFQIFEQIPKVVQAHNSVQKIDDTFRFFVFESEDDLTGVTLYSFARFIPKYHILSNKHLLVYRYINDNVNPDSDIDLENVILVDPQIFASIIIDTSKIPISSISLFVYDPKIYERSFNLKGSYFEYAKNKFKEFQKATRKISMNNYAVVCNLDVDKFFDNKNVNLAKKFARDTLDDQQYPVSQIVTANKALSENTEYDNFNHPVTIDPKERTISVDESSIGTLAAIMDGQIWKNMIHEKTINNL
ncbi:hypothetical protein [Oenococcus sicerae]